MNGTLELLCQEKKNGFFFICKTLSSKIIKGDYTMKTLHDRLRKKSFFTWFTNFCFEKPYTRSDYHNSYQIDSFVEDNKKRQIKKTAFRPLGMKNKDNNFLDNI